MADSFSIASRSPNTGSPFSSYLTPSPEAPSLVCWRTVVPLCCGLAGTVLIFSLTFLPLVSKLLLGLVLGLVIYGTMAAYFQHMRLWLLLGLVSLMVFCLGHNAWGEHRQAQQTMIQSVTQTGPLPNYFSNADQYHQLRDELFVHKAYWKAHGGELNPAEFNRAHLDQ